MKTLIRYLVTIGLISGVFLVLMELFIMPWYTRQGQERYLVNVKERPLKKALAVLESEGFRGVVYDTLFTNNQESNLVVDQFPAPNTKVKEGRTVRLTITRPEKMVAVPDLVGQSKRSALLMLKQAGLEVDTIFTEYNPEFPANTVVWQAPKAGDPVPKGLGVHLRISKGQPPNFYQVPDLFGLSQQKAVEKLKSAGLNLGKVFYRQNEDLIPYTVLEQSIEAGTVLDKPQAVDITISVLNMQDIFNQMMNQ
ncbi:MAG: PASTA domain-containing protein [Candidatus Neomarinimicrobiota bacterium]|nr:MAG: PASTA domain-containing protein [Candidatus Neomarinimicrobiota bacterium]